MVVDDSRRVRVFAHRHLQARTVFAFSRVLGYMGGKEWDVRDARGKADARRACTGGRMKPKRPK